MGIVFAEITIENVYDEADAERNRISEKDIRAVTVTAMVDTGSSTLVINEEVAGKLGLKKGKRRSTTLADGSRRFYSETNPVRINWKDRSTVCEPILAPDADEVLLGAIPLRQMNITVDPKGERLVGRPERKMIVHP